MINRGMLRSILFAFSIIWHNIEITDARDVPAMSEICNRLPGSSVCSGGGGTSGNSRLSDPNPNINAASASASASASAANDNTADTNANRESMERLRAQYCQRFADNFRYYCGQQQQQDSSAASNGDPKLKEFCPTYRDLCGGGGAKDDSPNASSSAAAGVNEQLTQICLQYRSAAANYCRTGPGQEESEQVRQHCDRYRANCADVLAAADAATISGDTMATTCAKYQEMYFSKCASKTPTAPEEITFCTNFAKGCGPTSLKRRSGGEGGGGGGGENSADSSKLVPPPPSGDQRKAPPPQPQPQQGPSASSTSSQGAGGAAPITVGRGAQVGNLAGVSDQTAIDPLNGFQRTRNVNAGPVNLQSGSGANFGGMLPFGLNNVLGGGGGRRRRRAYNL